MEIKLGDRVTFRKEFQRCVGLSDNVRFIDFDNKKQLEGIICGARTIAYRGYTKYWGDWNEFIPLEYRKIYLVATDLRGFHKVPSYFIEGV